MNLRSAPRPTKIILSALFAISSLTIVPACPALVDAHGGVPTAVVRMPWYLRALEVSRPLHFGACGGSPLKLRWALSDAAVISILLTGIYLWILRRRKLRPGSIAAEDASILPQEAT